ncbi:glutathione-disulfide reductase, partial [Burkholderia pseudomallei]
CVLRGCIPKQLLVYASHFSHDVEDAAGYGWTCDIGLFSWPTLIEAKDREIARLSCIYVDLLNKWGVEIHTGRATLV